MSSMKKKPYGMDDIVDIITIIIRLLTFSCKNNLIHVY